MLAKRIQNRERVMKENDSHVDRQEPKCLAWNLETGTAVSLASEQK